MDRVPAPEVYVTEELHLLLKGLPSSHKFRRWILDMKKVLLEHKYSGERIKKSLIPQYYIKNFGVYNLYRYDHPEGYRSCYTIVDNCPRILDIMSHAQYDLRFGYKTT